MKLKIFSDRSYLPEGIQHLPILSPFWGMFAASPEYPWTMQLKHYTEIGHSFFEFTSLEEADLAVMPFDWRVIRGEVWRQTSRNKVAQDLAISFAKEVEQVGKQLVVFFSGDCSDEEIPVKNAVVFRSSPYRSMQKFNDYVIPAWNEDLVEYYLGGQVPIRQKRTKPIVGFCGRVGKNLFRMKLKTILYHGGMLILYKRMGISPYKGHVLRSQALSTLSKSPMVDTNFVERDGFVFFDSGSHSAGKEPRLEFVQNMVDSDYVLCCRGVGNYSFRFYEALCCGRIPVFINTDCILPYDFAIDWKKYCVWVDESELPLIAEKVAEFHNSLSSQEFVDLQHECRRLWKQWLSPEGFFANFYRHFQVDMQKKAENSFESGNIVQD